MHLKNILLTKRQQEFTSVLFRSVLLDMLKKKYQIVLARLSQEKVNGTIIGTGAADFTTGNVEYEFLLEGKIFQLVDVPGIEGDESRYEHLVREAMAKAHLVFYVNGTNKKPEAQTAEKIKKYLKRSASVYAICNMRGKADSYEDDAQRFALDTTHKDSIDTQRQTREVLEKVLGNDIVLGVQSVQGLLGFCAVAYDENRQSTITPQRTDLGKSQRNYLRDFGSPTAMRSFSQLLQVKNVITSKFSTFEHDIVETNKGKVISLVDETLVSLQQYLEEHEVVAAKVKSQIDYCSKSIEERFQSFAVTYANKRNNALEQLFSTIDDGIYTIIRDDFGDKDDLERNAKRLMAKEQKRFVERVEKDHESQLAELSDNISREMRRLEEDIKRLQFEHDFDQSAMSSISLDGIVDAIEFNIKDFGGAVLNIGSYALSGMAIGSILPGIGNVIGAIVGAVVGMLSLALGHIFAGKDKKIRAAQAKARENIEDSKNISQPKFSAETKKIVSSVKAEVDTILHNLNAEITRMAEVKKIISQQIIVIQRIKSGVTRSVYGTI